MKKLFNSRFLIILAASLVVLILLAVGAVYLFDESDDVFIKSGYVLNPLSTTSEKYFFDENTGYKENLSSMIEFEDVDNNVVSVLKDSFLHYLDDSLSFLKRGAILDLDSVRGNSAVSFYNISDKLIIQRKDGGYIIEAAAGDLKLDNFVGRISDNKYIVVGDLNLKMAGNDTVVKGEYFEIVYVEEGIVNIENKDVKYQVTAQGTSISVDNKVIDLGDKKITVNGEDLMSITAITINGDENIELIPKGDAEEEEDPTGGGGGGGSGDGDGDGNGTGAGENLGPDAPGTGQEEDGGTGGTGNENIQTTIINDVVISLKSVDAGSTNIEVVFDIINAKKDDSFRLQVINLASGRTVDMKDLNVQVTPDYPINVQFLTPNTKYLFVVVNERDGGKYFQKILETNGFGIKFEKAYATESSLAYNLTVDEDTDVSNAKLTLKKFNEETKKYEIVYIKVKDSSGKEIERPSVVDISSLNGNYADPIVFPGLKSNTIYTAVLDGFVINNGDHGSVYEIPLTSMTLKKPPIFTELLPVKDVGSSSFDLSLGNITDEDSAIVSYTYYIYDMDDNNALAITPIKKSNASPITVPFGSGKEQLRSGTNYTFKTVIEYFDNEKYIEYITDGSIIFKMGKEPYVTIEPNNETKTHNYFSADIYLADSSCSIKLPDRAGCSAEVSPVSIIVSEMEIDINGKVKKTTHEIYENVKFTFENNEIKYTLEVHDLKPGTTYDIAVQALVNTGETFKTEEIRNTEKSIRTVTTRELAKFNVDWRILNANQDHVIYVNSQLLSAGVDTTKASVEETVAEMDKVVFKLYDGVVYNNFNNVNHIASKTVRNVKEEFFDKPYTISSLQTFNLTMKQLADLSEGRKLNEYYTIVMDVYTKDGSSIDLNKTNVYTYYVPDYLRKVITKPELIITQRSNTSVGKIFKNLNNNGTIVAYDLTGAYVRDSFLGASYTPQKMNFYVYSEDKRQLKFYIKDEESGELKLVDKVSVPLDTEERVTTTIYMDYGTEYDPNKLDEIMTRGNKFYVGFDITSLNGKTNKEEPLPNDEETLLTSPVGYGVYKQVETTKDSPFITLYAAKSADKSITYKYSINDPDNAMYTVSGYEGYSNIYVDVNNKSMVKIKAEDTDEEDKKAITIDGLNSGDIYRMYYYTLNKKYDDVKPTPYPVGDGDGYRTFDGHYNFGNDSEIKKHNFLYKIINNPRVDNKVTIKMLANEAILDRILGYKIKLSDEKGNTYEPENALWKLSECIGDPAGSVPRCLSIKYDDIKKMKSGDDEKNSITVEVTAIYDNGYSGFDFKVGPSENDDYKYCIMQANSSELGLGSYLSFNAEGTNVVAWNEDLDAPKGYYLYTLNSGDIFYKSQYNLDHRLHMYGGMGASGFAFGGHFLTPKMVSIDKLGCSGTDCDKFDFNSITPKVLVKENTKLINGSVQNLTLTGIDDANDIKLENGERYIYVDVWEKMSDVGKLDANGNIDKKYLARPTVKVPLDKEDPLKTVSAYIDGLKPYSESATDPTGTYYFNVYAWMKIGDEYVYQQLYDDDNGDTFKSKTYTLTSKSAGGVFQVLENTKLVISDSGYGNRFLNTDAVFLTYDNGIAFNFDVTYVLCDYEDTLCSLDHNIFKDDGKINIDNKMNVSIDLSKGELKDILYNKDYKLYIYAITKYYDSGNESKQEILINQWGDARNKLKLQALSVPEFIVKRDAKLIDGESVVDLEITVVDSHQTLVGNYKKGVTPGKYFIKLLDQSGNVAGTGMQLLDGNKNPIQDIENYTEHPIDAKNDTGLVRIKGLKLNATYSLEVYSDAVVNNSTLEEDKRIIRVSKPHTIYSASDYGVAFGNEITYTATANSIIVTFFGGSSFENVVAVNYTVARYDDPKDIYTKSGTFEIGKDGKKFEYDNYWRFIIDPEGMDNTAGVEGCDPNSTSSSNCSNIGLSVVISVDVKDPRTDEVIRLTKNDIPGFSGTAEWVGKK